MSCLVNSFQVTLKPTGWTEIFYQLNFQVNVQIVLGSSYQAFDSPKTEGTAGCILTSCVVIPVVDLHSKILDAPAPRSKFFHFHAVFGKNFIFMQFLGKFGKIVCRPPPPLPTRGLAPPPRENSGSVTAFPPCTILSRITALSPWGFL